MIAHRGLELVYCEAERGTAEPVFHEPSWEIEPTTLMVSPVTVETSSLKVTATVAGRVVQEGVEEEVVEEDEEVDEEEEEVLEEEVVLVPVPPVMAISAQER